MRSAADCLPRLSPPAASPAAIAATRRSASGSAEFARYASAVAWITCGPASMLPATLQPSPRRWPHHSMHASPVCAAPGPLAAITWSWRCARPASAAASVATTSTGAWPASSSARPAGPYSGFTSAWVASAPAPRRVCIVSAPTAKKRLAMAMPKRPSPSRARIDQVMETVPGTWSDDRSSRPALPTRRRATCARLPWMTHDRDTHLTTLANGVRVVTLSLPYLDSVAVSVFVRTGSRHESRRLNGISHVVEHMAFKGTAARTCQQINLDAERLGAEVNAHTDKDHTAYHMRGLARHAGPFLHMLGDIVQHSSFPEAELERERQVILHELTEDDDDPMSTAYKLFDRACFGLHPVAQPVIGTRHNIERFTRAELLDYVQRQYTGANVVVGVAGRIDPSAVVREAEAAFGAMPAGAPNGGDAPR